MPLTQADSRTIDPILLAVIANRFEAIVREMTHTLQKAAYSTLISVSRDFSCAIVTGDHQLLASAEGLPVQNYGADIQTKSMCDLHADLRPGDAFLHNDPYLGNSHTPDLGVLVPVFAGDRHLFTAVAKGHVADSGGPTPGSESIDAADVYSEGTLVFPAIRVERDYQEIHDITRMARQHVRFPELWYGDYRAMLGAARTAERRLGELVDKYGADVIEQAAAEWLDYSERMMANEVRKLPGGRITAESRMDPLPVAPDGIPLRVEITVDEQAGYVDVDLRDNIDCLPAGINASVAATLSAVMQGVSSVVDSGVPHNAGAFRRVRVLLRENCIVGIPRFPASCSMATSIPTNRLINLVQSAFAQLGEGWGIAEGGIGLGVSYPGITGFDPRRGADYHAFFPAGNNGGPASPHADGWVTYTIPCVAGLLYRNSVEIDERQFPLRFRTLRIISGSGGAGRFRGGPTVEVSYGPTSASMAVESMADGYESPARGVRGGADGCLAASYKVGIDGTRQPLASSFSVELAPGEYVTGHACGGGGYGDPLERDPQAVLQDVEERWIPFDDALDIYGVVLRPKSGGGYEVDVESTADLRAQPSTAGP
ncbi:N-methylhydantoinase B [Kibdelosporangium banguiense]|uniref:N-methylhydantoinase B n=1 Tax=Kibdelosporangium banguiense TaxID=1365924 RepID=A0ABS4TZC7_9PSEU|nr:hydantoinase B/oxoprolinase family protein [Kibdelosporangium banguiense]MBP2329270.1 N-methylhydantoinase B [Kibdelosporangium banguiense]